MLLTKVVIEDLKIDQMNVDTTFLNPTYEEEIYIKILEYFYLVNLEITKDIHYMRLLKSLYRLKQAPRT